MEIACHIYERFEVMASTNVKMFVCRFSKVSQTAPQPLIDFVRMSAPVMTVVRILME